MKKTLLFIAATLFVACSGNNHKKNASDTPEDINALIPELVKHIPDGEIPADAEEYFTPEYYSLLKQAWSVPEPEEGIGDEEFLNYFIEGNGDCPGNHECKNCKSRYVPKYRSVFMAPHFGTTRQMRCPHCHKITWHKKVINKE